MARQVDTVPLRYAPALWSLYPETGISKLHGQTSDLFSSCLSLNNKQLSQMLKSSAPAQEEEEDPLAYYENHTSQIEVRWKALGVPGRR